MSTLAGELVWSPQQQIALNKACTWLDARPGSAPPLFYLAGYAGTGKSELARAINAHIGNRALAAAYTGKAASVMRRKGLLNATTIHRLIYQPAGNDAGARLKGLQDERARVLADLETLTDENHKRLRRGRIAALDRQIKELTEEAHQPRFTLKEESDLEGARLLILDECSMVDVRTAEDLLSFGVPVLVMGDPAQLPPVKGAGYFTDRAPDALLTEIHRQAANSPILRLATLAREGRELPMGEWTGPNGDTARVVRKVTADQALGADMILTGTNAMRQTINRRHRQLAGHTHPMPQPGERLMCLKNNHERGLQNGTLWCVLEGDSEWRPGQSTVYLRLQSEDGGPADVFNCEADLFLDDQKKGWFNNEQFTFGSACTVHKAQGSQFDNVIMFDNWPSNRNYREWLYTGVTRAAKHLTVVVQ